MYDVNETADCINHTYYIMSLPARYTIFSVYSLFTILVIFGNILVLMAFFKTEKLRTSSNNFLLSLSGADLLLAPVVMGFANINEIFDFEMPSDHYIPCVVLLAGNHCIILASILSIVGISIERYICIFHPYYYISRVNPTSTTVAVSLIWFASVSLSSPVILYNDVLVGKSCDIRSLKHWQLGRILGPVIVGSLSIITALYMRIFAVALKQSRNIEALATSISSARISETDNQMVRLDDKRKTESGITKMAATVIGLLYLMWLPVLFLSLVEQCQEKRWLHFLKRVTEILNYSNAFINPIVYHYRSKDFRDAFKKILNSGRRH